MHRITDDRARGLQARRERQQNRNGSRLTVRRDDKRNEGERERAQHRTTMMDSRVRGDDGKEGKGEGGEGKR